MNQQLPTSTLTVYPANEASQHVKGMIMVLTGAVLWGLSGTAAQVLFEHDHVSPLWLVTVRMGISGLLLIAVVIWRQGIAEVVRIFTHFADMGRLSLFAVLGLIGVQYSYFAAIRYGNAATATLLQNLGPALLTMYLTFSNRRLPETKQIIAVVIAFLGTFLLVTGGHLNGLQISPVALFWGLFSAVALAFYTIFPSKIIHTYGTAATVGWAMIIGAVILSIIDRPWHVHIILTVSSMTLIGFVVIFGTFLAFYLYLASIKLISPTETSLFASAEPLTATVVAIVFLHVHLTAVSIFGGILIILMVILLAIKPRTIQE
jgi:drug/metabolite transporter (DMT)-like permease